MKRTVTRKDGFTYYDYESKNTLSIRKVCSYEDRRRSSSPCFYTAFEAHIRR